VTTPFQELVRSRRSIRRFSPAPVGREKILACLEAARLAPSAENVQPWRFLVVDEPELKADLASEAFSGLYSMCRFAGEAPVLIVLLGRLDFLANRLARRIQGIQFYLLDLGIAGEHFILQAQELGLGTCWIGWFNSRKVRSLLKIPRDLKIVAIIPVGYAAKNPPREMKRKPLEQIAWFNEIKDL